MSLEFKYENRPPNGRQFKTNVTFARSDHEIVFFRTELALNYQRISQLHGDTVSNLIFALRCFPNVGSIYLKSDGITVYMKDIFGWDNAIDSAVRQSAEKLYAEQKTSFVFQTNSVSPSVRKYNTTTEIGRRTFSLYLATDAGPRLWERIEADHGQRISRMVRDLLSLAGVESVSVEPYSVSVRKPFGAFSLRWERIDDIVKAAIGDIAAQASASGKRVVVEKYHGAMRSWHTTFEVSEARIESFDKPLRDSSEPALRRIGPTGAAIVRAIYSRIGGVVTVWIKPYEVEVKLAEAFSFDEKDASGLSIADRVNQILTDVCGPITFTEKGR